MDSAKFKIRGATTNREHEIVFLCRWFGEPFWVEPHFMDSKARKKAWAHHDTYFNKWLLVGYTRASKRGVPLEGITGLSISDTKNDEVHVHV